MCSRNCSNVHTGTITQYVDMERSTLNETLCHIAIMALSKEVNIHIPRKRVCRILIVLQSQRTDVGSAVQH